jgi:hypothetical protein
MVHLRSISISLRKSNSRDQFKSLFDPTNPLALVTAPIQGVRIKSVMKNGDRNAERPQPPDDDWHFSSGHHRIAAILSCAETQGAYFQQISDRRAVRVSDL